MNNAENELPSNDTSPETTNKEIEKKEKNKMSNRKFAIIATPILLVVCAASIGGTVLIYNAMKPEAPTMLGSPVNYNELISRVNSNPTKPIDEIFVNDKYNMANFVLAKVANNPYIITVGEGESGNNAVKQTISMTTIVTPEKVFNQNISTTERAPLNIDASTALRVYDTRDNKISYYPQKKSSEWASATAREVNYDSFIESYGKLFIPSYSVTVDENNKFSYVSNGTSGSVQVNSVFDYNFNAESVHSITLTKENNGSFSLALELDPIYSCIFYSRKVKTNGDLSKTPYFQGYITVNMELDSNFNLVSSSSKEVYTAVLSGVTQTMTGTMASTYSYSSDAQNFKYNGKAIAIPEINEDLSL